MSQRFRSRLTIRPSLEQLENRFVLACTGLGGTQVECFASDGPGSPQSSWLPPVTVDHAVEGYTSESSVAPGEALELHVSTATPQNYRVEIYRLGWYDGDGGRLVACLPDCAGGSFAGTDQGIPVPDPVTLEVRANWSVTQSFVVPNDWASGYYLANLILTTGPNVGTAHRIPFIVRAEAARNASILVEVPVNTWQAYNDWGGHSLYDPAAADKVSFDRPYDNDNLGSILRYELEFVRFLEREGFDVEYATNVDVHRDPGIFQDHEVVVSSGHNEYWTGEIRTAYETARDGGTDLVFMGSNTGYWQVRYENSEQTVVGYKVTPATANQDPEPDPAKKSMLFRDLTPPRPECSLLGVQFMQTFTPNFSPDESLYPDYAVVASSLNDPWFDDTGIVSSAVFEHRVGYEWDQIVPGCRTGLTTLFQYDAGSQSAHATKYTAASGATVFATGSMGFNFALDNWRSTGQPPVSPADPRLQTFMRNVLNDLSNAATTPITIRAAGDTGQEQMQLQVDGVVVRTWNNVGGDFDQRIFQTFTYNYPGALTADQIRVAFSNDGTTASGADINLNVDAMVVNGITYESESPQTYSVGSYSSDNGCGGGNKLSETLHCPGYFQFAQPQAGTTLEILAAGETGTEQMQLQIDGVPVRTWNNIAGNADQGIFQSFLYAHPTPISLDQVRVAFTNDGNTASGADRNLVVDALLFNGQRFETEAPTTYSTGTYDAATGCAPGNKQQQTLHCGGYFQYEVPTSGSVVDILAAGYTGEEQMQLLVDGVPVRTWNNVGGDVDQREFLSFTYTHPTTLALNQVRVAFTNDGNTAAGADRNLAVDAITLNGVRYESEAPTTYSTGTWSDATGCAPGNKQDEVIHCGGYFQYGGAQNGPKWGTRSVIIGTDHSGGSQNRGLGLPTADTLGNDGSIATTHAAMATLYQDLPPTATPRLPMQSNLLPSHKLVALAGETFRHRSPRMAAVDDHPNSVDNHIRELIWGRY